MTQWGIVYSFGNNISWQNWLKKLTENYKRTELNKKKITENYKLTELTKKTNRKL